jgi:hypothetical protein
MNDTREVKDFWYKLGGYYLIPHELLHVLAYRLIGKPCHYDWGDYYVRPLAKRTRRERLFVLLFPFIVCWLLGFFFHFLWGASALLVIRMPLERYFFESGPTWHFALPIIATGFIIYSGTAHADLIIAYRVLVGKDKSHEES